MFPAWIFVTKLDTLTQIGAEHLQHAQLNDAVPVAAVIYIIVYIVKP